MYLSQAFKRITIHDEMYKATDFICDQKGGRGGLSDLVGYG
jgi:hypothetical protein